MQPALLDHRLRKLLHAAEARQRSRFGIVTAAACMFFLAPKVGEVIT
jgi:hypothetical protein